MSSEIGKQIAATQSESARHALAYGRFEEMILDAYELVPNVQKVISKAFDLHGLPTGQHMPSTLARPRICYPRSWPLEIEMSDP